MSSSHLAASTQQSSWLPSWAGEAYLSVAILSTFIYCIIFLFSGDVSGLALLKIMGLVFLVVYAVLSNAKLLALALTIATIGSYSIAVAPDHQSQAVNYSTFFMLVYIAIFALLMRQNGVRSDGLITAFAIMLHVVAVVVLLSNDFREDPGPVLVYVGVISTMSVLGALTKGPKSLAFGSLLFIFSDSLTGMRWLGVVDFQPGGLNIGQTLEIFTYFLAHACFAHGIIALRTKGLEEKSAHRKVDA